MERLLQNNLNLARLLFVISYSDCMLIQIFVPCYFGTIVIGHFNAVTRSLYFSNWIPQTPRFQSSMQIFVARTLPPVAIKGGGLFPLNLSTFISVSSDVSGQYNEFRFILEKFRLSGGAIRLFLIRPFEEFQLNQFWSIYCRPAPWRIWYLGWWITSFHRFSVKCKGHTQNRLLTRNTQTTTSFLHLAAIVDIFWVWPMAFVVTTALSYSSVW